jgi:hypothetical protein
MNAVGFESAIPASERPQIYALDSAATGIGKLHKNTLIKLKQSVQYLHIM